VISETDAGQIERHVAIALKNLLATLAQYFNPLTGDAAIEPQDCRVVSHFLF
jgi:hypothetical protein